MTHPKPNFVDLQIFHEPTQQTFFDSIPNLRKKMHGTSQTSQLIDSKKTVRKNM